MSNTSLPNTTGDARGLSLHLATAFHARQQQRLKSGDGLGDALRHGGIGGFEAASPYAACLIPLLNALGWQGSLRELTESLPHFANELDLTDLRNVLGHLGYSSNAVHSRLSAMDPRLLPSLFVGPDGTVMVVLERTDQGYRIFNGATGQENLETIVELHGEFFIISEIEEDDTPTQAPQTSTWMGQLVRRFRGTLGLLLTTTFILNLLSLVVPLYIMSIYDQVIPAQSTRVLVYLASGVAIALCVEMVIRVLRARLTAYLGGRLENLIANATFAQILSLPPSLTETASVGAQAARLREFDSIRDMFTGPLISVGLELPFVVLFIAVIALLGGTLAFVPVVMMLLYFLIGGLLLPSLKRSVKKSSRARAERHGFLVEMLTHARTIKQLAAESVWVERYRALSAKASFAHFRTAQMSFLLQTLAQAIMMGAGIATIGFGVLKVVDGAMSIGALIATMALVWRVLSPLQNLFLALTRFEQVKLSIKQINQLMAMPKEHRDQNAKRLSRQFIGDVAFDRVSFRYRADTEPALLGITFAVPRGQSIAIIGGNGAGKSTILNMLAALYRPQAGQVTIDGIDIRQIDPIELRQTIAYVPQEVELFHGTIAQNLRLGQPTASDDDLRRACADIGILDQILSLPDGFNTRIGDQRLQQLNYGFRQSIAIARALLRNAPIILLDEAARSLDDAGDQAFCRMLENLRGRATVIMVSHRPSHIKLCDQALILDKGIARGVGRPADVLATANGGTL